jgi:hypothetical protein
MKRRAEFLVRKRDGRSEWLRATKLVRSIQLALAEAGCKEPWRAMPLATAVLTGLRARLGTARPMPTAELAGAVEHVLCANGLPEAAHVYAAARAELQRRQDLLRLRGATNADRTRAWLEPRLAPESWPGHPLGR